MSRFFDRGAITAAWVGVGMAVTIGVSFLLVIPIEAIYTGIIAPGCPVAWLAGLTIGYYANAPLEPRTAGRGAGSSPTRCSPGVVTAVTFALLFLGVKALFFAADNGYRDASTGGSLTCTAGRRLRVPALRRAPARASSRRPGSRTSTSSRAFYWNQQLNTALGLVIATVVASAAGGVVFRLTNSTLPATQHRRRRTGRLTRPPGIETPRSVTGASW